MLIEPTTRRELAGGERAGGARDDREPPFGDRRHQGDRRRVIMGERIRRHLDDLRRRVREQRREHGALTRRDETADHRELAGARRDARDDIGDGARPPPLRSHHLSAL